MCFRCYSLNIKKDITVLSLQEKIAMSVCYPFGEPSFHVNSLVSKINTNDDTLLHESLHHPILFFISLVETIAQDVENDKGLAALDSSQIGGKKPQSNTELHVYTRRNLQQKKVQPIIPTLKQMDSLEISPENVPGNTDSP